ncbi:branched-chain amino acid ABC transporter permease [Megalodesulfovibrio gigas]|uniref:Putative branched-chain amino acid ABC-type transport system, permease component n=1 Tax=Megalodesulfovibrio gigas (strain ATCC 19364 / DSM 1382 / NCIMB 9332 / VKM B-1759) TaxID=1121448 RepID=T2GCV6_MEGG1|nr:branched-chain amino acid ABC transporter permease [Megalodesulfovibrio gigas]AGW13961.1 putative branched-chain amino acid ABC-type transport system, permease component [Megalodesulfovibrio gigas DSM 1382 = ATCC 19364]
MLEQQLVNGLTLGVIYALIAVGYTMVYGVIELINFAHGEVYMIGAFLCVTFITAVGLPFYVSMLLAMICAAAIGVSIDRIAYRPLRSSPRLAVLITAIGMSIFLQNLAMIIWGSRPVPFPQDAVPAYLKLTAIEFSGVHLSWLQLFIFAVTFSMMLLLYVIINHTRMGTAMRALAQNRTCSQLMGVNVNRVIAFTFALGSSMGAVAGVLVAVYYNTLSPTMGYVAGVKAFAAAVLGGIGSVPGAMLGGIVLGIAEALGAGYVSSLYRDGVAYAVLIAVIIFRPSGLLGKALVEKA